MGKKKKKSSEGCKLALRRKKRQRGTRERKTIALYLWGCMSFLCNLLSGRLRSSSPFCLAFEPRESEIVKVFERGFRSIPGGYVETCLDNSLLAESRSSSAHSVWLLRSCFLIWLTLRGLVHYRPCWSRKLYNATCFSCHPCCRILTWIVIEGLKVVLLSFFVEYI